MQIGQLIKLFYAYEGHRFVILVTIIFPAYPV